MVAAGTLEVEGLAGTGNGSGECLSYVPKSLETAAHSLAKPNCAGTDGRTLLQMPRRLATSPHRFADALHKSLLFCILI